jgi:hypothetical protein
VNESYSILDETSKFPIEDNIEQSLTFEDEKSIICDDKKVSEFKRIRKQFGI